MWLQGCANFQPKRTTLTFLAQIYPKIVTGLYVEKTDVGKRTSILEIPRALIFRQNRQLQLFLPTFTQKWILGSEFQKYKSGFGISASKNHVCQFSVKMDNFEFFGLNLGILPNYLPHFGPYNIERAEWRLKWAGWRLEWTRWKWVELDGGVWRWMELDGGDYTV